MLPLQREQTAWRHVLRLGNQVRSRPKREGGENPLHVGRCCERRRRSRRLDDVGLSHCSETSEWEGATGG